MTTRLTRQSLAHYAERLERITADQRPRWGRLTPTELMPHLQRVFEISLGAYEAPDISNPLSRSALKWVALYLPWPKGRVKAPDYFTPAPQADLEAERRRCLEAMERFVDLAERDPDRRTASPVFGPMPLRTWQRLHARHLEHHCGQFGV